MKAMWLTAALFGVTAPLAAQERALAGFDDYVAKALAEWRVPGVAIAIVRNDSVILAKGYGVKQLGRPDPVTAQTLFEIGSTSKAFSSALAAMLVDDGVIGWDDPIRRHLPWFELADPYLTQNVTLRDAFSHRTGILGAYNGVVTWTREKVLRQLRYLTPAVPFRSRYEYSNMMYSAAGEAVAAAAGKPWERLLAERILSPLGMGQTTTDISRFFDSTLFAKCFYCALPDRPVTLDDVRNGHDAALPHQMVGDSVRPIAWQSYDNAVSAGSVISNAADMAQWLRFLTSGGVHDGKRLLRSANFDAMLTPQSVLYPAGWIQLVDSVSPSTHFWSYGLGWRLNDYRSRKVVWHTGGIIGFLAYVGFVPEENLGIAVLSNGDMGYAWLPQALAYRIIDLHLGAPMRDWSRELLALNALDRARGREAERALQAQRVEGAPPSRPMTAYAGRYRNDLMGEVSVVAGPGGLEFRIPEGGDGVLQPWHYDVFRLRLSGTWAGGQFATFAIGRDGAVASVTIDGMGTFRRD